jgi:hypothetical protein
MLSIYLKMAILRKWLLVLSYIFSNYERSVLQGAILSLERMESTCMRMLSDAILERSIREMTFNMVWMKGLLDSCLERDAEMPYRYYSMI